MNTRNKKNRLLIQNTTIAIIMIISLLTMIFSFLPVSGLSDAMYSLLEMRRMVSRIFSIALLITSFNLCKRKRTAWWITVFLTGFNLLLHIYHSTIPVHALTHIVFFYIVCDIAVLSVLLSSYRDFCCPAGRSSLKRAFIFLLLSLAGIVGNAGISYHYLKTAVTTSSRTILFLDSLADAAGTMFGTSDSWVSAAYKGVHFQNFLFWFSWGCIILAVLYMVKPWIAQQFYTARDLEHARALVRMYGQNPASYLTLEEDKLLYFGRKADGVIPYATTGNTVIVNGDPVCSDEDFPALLAEFREFCEHSAHNVFFLSITGHFLEEYKKQGFGCVKSGEEARFLLPEYSIEGKKGAKMRMNINHATKSGITVHEYKVSEKRDGNLEQEFERVTREWLSKKKSGLLTFTMGGVGLDNPMDKRYFYASAEDGRMMGFIVFCPFESMNGYMADVTRHAGDAPGGIIEKIMYEAFQIFKEEGILYASLGLAPLANVLPSDREPSTMERLLDFVYTNLNNCYGFKDLYRAKEKYSPTMWLPGYYAFLPRIPTPGMLYSVVKIQNPQGMWDYIKAYVKNRRGVSKNKEKQENKSI